MRCEPTARPPIHAPTLQSGAPKTGQQMIEDRLRDEALTYFFKDPRSVKCTPTSGGVNNVVRGVVHSGAPTGV